MCHNKLNSSFLLICLTIVAAVLPRESRALTITSGPFFTPATNAPLAGLLELTTDVDSRVSVSVNTGTNSWERNFFDFDTTHSIPLLGFQPDQTNIITVTVYDEDFNSLTDTQSLTFITAPLPANFPHSVVLMSEPTNMEAGYTLLIVQNRTANSAYIVAYDNSGNVAWYIPWNTHDVDVRQLDDGDLFIEEPTPANHFLEVSMLGDTNEIFNAPSAYPVNVHDGVPTGNGTILYFSNVGRSVANFPLNDTNPNPAVATRTVSDDRIVEMSVTNGTALNVWSTMDMLDPTRVTYLTYGEYSGAPDGVDNYHANGVIEDTNDNSIIVSLRNQNAVFNFTRQGDLKWILGPHALWSTSFQPFLLNPVGSPFEWNYGQHAPQLTPQGTLLVFDDGSYRASPYDPPVADQNNYSRGVEYSIDETNMTVSQVWDTTQAAGDVIYSPIMGKAQWLPQTHDVLVTYSFITYLNGVHPSTNAPNATMVQLIEYTHDPIPKVVFDLSFFDYDNTNSTYLGYLTYRSMRIPDLYAHPANPVSDIVTSEKGGSLDLEFAADPSHNYIVQASTDLKNWTSIGSAEVRNNNGEFDFIDTQANQFKSRFYRIITE